MDPMIFTWIWLFLGVIIGIKSLERPHSLLMFVSIGCFLASFSAFLAAPFVIQLVVFVMGTIVILIIEEA